MQCLGLPWSQKSPDAFKEINFYVNDVAAAASMLIRFTDSDQRARHFTHLQTPDFDHSHSDCNPDNVLCLSREGAGL